MQPPLQHCEIAIAGAGPAGTAAAICLAQAGHQVCLFDSSTVTDFKIGEGLPPAATSLLRDLALWPQFLADQHRISHGNLSIWGTDSAHHDDFLRHLHGAGYQLDRPRFELMLRTRAIELGVRLFEGTHISIAPNSQPDHTDGTYHLICRTSKQNWPLQANFLLDASGRNASLARKCGAEQFQLDQLTAFFALFKPVDEAAANASVDQDGRSMIEAVENGWWYSVLLPSRQRLFTFFSDLDLVERQELLSPQGFLANLQKTKVLNQLLQQHMYQLQTAPQGKSAISARLRQAYGQRWLAVGDAANAFDPLSSQGIAQALYGGMRAAQAVHGHLTGVSDALTIYDSHLRQIFANYLHQRLQNYSLETRWPEHAFWQRRQAG